MTQYDVIGVNERQDDAIDKLRRMGRLAYAMQNNNNIAIESRLNALEIRMSNNEHLSSNNADRITTLEQDVSSLNMKVGVLEDNIDGLKEAVDEHDWRIKLLEDSDLSQIPALTPPPEVLSKFANDLMQMIIKDPLKDFSYIHYDLIQIEEWIAMGREWQDLVDSDITRDDFFERLWHGKGGYICDIIPKARGQMCLTPWSKFYEYIYYADVLNVVEKLMKLSVSGEERKKIKRIKKKFFGVADGSVNVEEIYDTVNSIFKIKYCDRDYNVHTLNYVIKLTHNNLFALYEVLAEGGYNMIGGEYDFISMRSNRDEGDGTGEVNLTLHFIGVKMLSVVEDDYNYVEDRFADIRLSNTEGSSIAWFEHDEGGLHTQIDFWRIIYNAKSGNEDYDGDYDFPLAVQSDKTVKELLIYYRIKTRVEYVEDLADEIREGRDDYIDTFIGDLFSNTALTLVNTGLIFRLIGRMGPVVIFDCEEVQYNMQNVVLHNYRLDQMVNNLQKNNPANTYTVDGWYDVPWGQELYGGVQNVTVGKIPLRLTTNNMITANGTVIPYKETLEFDFKNSVYEYTVTGVDCHHRVWQYATGQYKVSWRCRFPGRSSYHYFTADSEARVYYRMYFDADYEANYQSGHFLIRHYHTDGTSVDTQLWYSGRNFVTIDGKDYHELSFVGELNGVVVTARNSYTGSTFEGEANKTTGRFDTRTSDDGKWQISDDYGDQIGVYGQVYLRRADPVITPEVFDASSVEMYDGTIWKKKLSPYLLKIALKIMTEVPPNENRDFDNVVNAMWMQVLINGYNKMRIDDLETRVEALESTVFDTRGPVLTTLSLTANFSNKAAMLLGFADALSGIFQAWSSPTFNSVVNSALATYNVYALTKNTLKKGGSAIVIEEELKQNLPESAPSYTKDSRWAVVEPFENQLFRINETKSKVPKGLSLYPQGRMDIMSSALLDANTLSKAYQNCLNSSNPVMKKVGAYISRTTVQPEHQYVTCRYLDYDLKHNNAAQSPLIEYTTRIGVSEGFTNESKRIAKALPKDIGNQLNKSLIGEITFKAEITSPDGTKVLRSYKEMDYTDSDIEIMAARIGCSKHLSNPPTESELQHVYQIAYDRTINPTGMSRIVASIPITNVFDFEAKKRVIMSRSTEFKYNLALNNCQDFSHSFAKWVKDNNPPKWLSQGDCEEADRLTVALQKLTGAIR